MSKEYSAEFKLEVVLLMLRDELTTAEISQKYGVDRGVINRWRREAIEHLKKSSARICHLKKHQMNRKRR